MTTPSTLFRFSRSGNVIRENVTLAEAVRLVSDKTILPTDHYWTQGMTDWKLVSSRSWENPPETARPAPTPVPVPATTPVITPPPAQPKPMVAPVAASPAAKPLVVEKGFSPYATYYRSKDQAWAYGIFGGLAHRNCWTSSQLGAVRVLTAFFIFPALAYLFGWGLMVMFLTPPLPTAGVRSYYDVSTSQTPHDPRDYAKIAKLAVGAVILVVLVILLAKLFS
jgi:hypothetical protein